MWTEQYSISFLIFLAVLLFFIIKQFKKTDSNKKLPPEPWKLPILGHVHHLIATQPHRALANMAEKLGPIVHLQLGEISAIVISSPSLAKDIMKTHDISFANRPKLQSTEIVAYNNIDIAFSPYGDYWRQMRKICVLELLSAKKVQSFRSLREQESWNLIESMAMKGSTSVNLTDKIMTMMNTIMCQVAVGSKCKDQVTLVALIDELGNLSSGFDVSDLFPSFKLLPLVTGTRNKLMKLRKKMDKILDNFISDHQERCAFKQANHENEDLLDVLLRLKNDVGLEVPITNDNIKAVILDMFGAGTDTSSVTIIWAMSELMKNPKIMKKAQTEIREVLKGKRKIHESDIQELAYLKLVIKETVRLHPPVPFLLPRECREKCEIGGYEIPIKTKVIINTWKLSRNPDYWVNPERFVPERFKESSISMMGTDFEYLPFGSGRRMCPGIMLGLANLDLPLAMLLYHFNWELPNNEAPEELEMTDSLGATLKRKNDLFLVPSPYNASH
ncbi:germacrene A hydroxylase-like [Rutidosis leptorrhynchoides]|uniref:germacrene A hydroxylase-like n=1 Tax=Rutidosis leptorrhynchoides TaxID=125765 RepID=UPI003A99CC0F